LKIALQGDFTLLSILWMNEYKKHEEKERGHQTINSIASKQESLCSMKIAEKAIRRLPPKSQPPSPTNEPSEEPFLDFGEEVEFNYPC